MTTLARWGRCVLIASIVGSLAMGPASVAWATAGQVRSGSGSVSGRSSVLRDARPVDTEAADVKQAAAVELLVAFDPKHVSVAAINNAHRAVHARPTKMFSIVPGLQLVELPAGLSVDDAIRQYEAMPGVRYAEANAVYELAGFPNDPLFAQQWGFNNTGQTGGTADADMDAVEAWGHTTGSSDVIVAVVDTGVDYNHPDLVGNMWHNPDEIADNGVDDDHNGWIDDVYGIDTRNADSDPLDDNGHGTHVAGTIGAAGNNAVGVTGVSWNVKIMALKTFDDSGTLAGDILGAWEYARNEGAAIINNSWGGGGSSALRDAIAANPALFVCAAGNGWADGIGDNNDGALAFYPASYDLPNIISVGASDSKDLPASYSNYGATSVDVFAPGSGILSTHLPEVTGVASDASVRVLTQDQFVLLDGWQQNYVVGTRPNLPSWSLKSDAYTSAPYSVGINGYVNNQYSILAQSAAVDLTAADHPGMRYKVRVDTELDWDYLVSGMFDGTSLHSAGWITGDSQGAFIQQVVDFAEYAGSNTYKPYFALIADASNSSAQGYDGVWVDDVEVFDIDPGASGDVWAHDYTNAYATMSGTSMATPHVSGLAALLLAQDPARDTAALKAKILGSVDVLPSLSGKCVTGGRINAHRALNHVPVANADAYPASSGVKLQVPASGVLANDTDQDGDTKLAALASGPTHGNVTLSPDGSFEYTSSVGFTGTDTFTYRAKDDVGESTSATVTITVTDAPPPVALTPVYRFYNFGNGTHFFTPNEDEKAQVIANLWAVYQYEGVAYSLNPTNNSAQLYRFYNRSSRSHFYTASDAEAGNVMANLSHIFQYDGRTYSVNPTQVPNSIPVYRFYNLRNGSHFYTADESEKADVQARLWQTYQYEGPAFWLGQ